MTPDEPMTGTPDGSGHDTPDPKHCNAKKRSGGPCTRPSGWGTEHPGIGRCKLHGGTTESHNVAARREQARRDVALFAARKDIHPAQALLELVQWTAGEVDYWRMRVAELDETDLVWGVSRIKSGGEDGGTTREAKPHIAYAMYADASKRLESHSVAALRAGVEAELLRVAQNAGAQLAGVLRSVLDRLGLNDEQRVLALQVVPEELRRISAGDVVPGEVTEP